MKKLIMLLFALATVAGVEAQTVYIATSNSAIAYHKSKDCSYLKNSKTVEGISTTKAKEMGRHACVRCYPELKTQTLKNIEKEKQTKKATPTTQNVYITSAKSATAYHKNKSCTYLKKATDIQSITAAKAKELNRVPCKVCYPSATTTTKSAKPKATTTKKAETTPKKAATTTKAEPTAPKKKETTKEKKPTSTTNKNTPARDEKGRFIKKTDTETKTTTKKPTKKAA